MSKQLSTPTLMVGVRRMQSVTGSHALLLLLLPLLVLLLLRPWCRQVWHRAFPSRGLPSGPA